MHINTYPFNTDRFYTYPFIAYPFNTCPVHPRPFNTYPLNGIASPVMAMNAKKNISLHMRVALVCVVLLQFATQGGSAHWSGRFKNADTNTKTQAQKHKLETQSTQTNTPTYAVTQTQKDKHEHKHKTYKLTLPFPHRLRKNTFIWYIVRCIFLLGIGASYFRARMCSSLYLK